jgi:hypothetical protein
LQAQLPPPLQQQEQQQEGAVHVPGTRVASSHLHATCEALQRLLLSTLCPLRLPLASWNRSNSALTSVSV